MEQTIQRKKILLICAVIVALALIVSSCASYSYEGTYKIYGYYDANQNGKWDRDSGEKEILGFVVNGKILVGDEVAKEFSIKCDDFDNTYEVKGIYQPFVFKHLSKKALLRAVHLDIRVPPYQGMDTTKIEVESTFIAEDNTFFETVTIYVGFYGELDDGEHEDMDILPVVTPTSTSALKPADPPGSSDPKYTSTPTLKSDGPGGGSSGKATATSTATPTPEIEIVLDSAYTDGTTGTVTFRLVKGPTKTYSAVVNGKTYTCSLGAGINKKIICKGPAFPVGSYVKVTLYLNGTEVWSGQVYQPLPPTPTKGSSKGE